MFMKEGAIVDSGTHDQLMAGDNEYATLIKMFYTQEKEEENKPGTMKKICKNTENCSNNPRL